MFKQANESLPSTLRLVDQLGLERSRTHLAALVDSPPHLCPTDESFPKTPLDHSTQVAIQGDTQTSDRAKKILVEW